MPSFSFQSAIIILSSKKLISGEKSNFSLGTIRLLRSSLNLEHVVLDLSACQENARIGIFFSARRL